MTKWTEQTLFKYVGSTVAVKAMLEGQLRFSTVSELNDPCELLDVINEDRARITRQQLLASGYSDEEFDCLKQQEAMFLALAPEHLAIRCPETKEAAHELLKKKLYTDHEWLAEEWRETVQTIRSRAGILSLTQSPSRLPMWAHYAANATGFLMTMERLDMAFPGDTTGVLNTPKKVVYGDEYEGMTFVPSSQENLFFWKHLDWELEQEVRVVCRLADCASYEIPNGGPTIHRREIDERHITGVVIGWNTPETERDRVLDAARKRDRSVVVHQARVEGTQIVFDRIAT